MKQITFIVELSETDSLVSLKRGLSVLESFGFEIQNKVTETEFVVEKLRCLGTVF